MGVCTGLLSYTNQAVRTPGSFEHSSATHSLLLLNTFVTMCTSAMGEPVLCFSLSNSSSAFRMLSSMLKYL